MSDSDDDPIRILQDSAEEYDDDYSTDSDRLVEISSELTHEANPFSSATRLTLAEVPASRERAGDDKSGTRAISETSDGQRVAEDFRRLVDRVRKSNDALPMQDRTASYLGEKVVLHGFDANTGTAIIQRGEGFGRGETREVQLTNGEIKDKQGREYTEIDLGGDHKLYRDQSGAIFALVVDKDGKPVLQKQPGMEAVSPRDSRLRIDPDLMPPGEANAPTTDLLRPPSKGDPLVRLLERISRVTEGDSAVRPSPAVIAQSNNYAEDHRLSGRIGDGFRTAGQNRQFSADGTFNAADRAATVVDRNRDQVLRQIIDDAKQQFADLPPRERARALAEYVNKVMGPADGNERKLDEQYRKLMADNAGKSLLLGEFVGKGACTQRSLLLKVLADEMGLDCSVVRGNGGAHVWNTFNFGDGAGDTTYDVRAKQYGLTNSPDHRPLAPGGAGNSEFVVGQEVDLLDSKWRVSGYDTQNGSVLLQRSTERTVNENQISQLNPGKSLTVGDSFKLPGQIMEEGRNRSETWTLQGRNDDGTLRFVRVEEKSVRRSELSEAVVEMSRTPTNIEHLKDKWKEFVEDNTSLTDKQRERLLQARDALEGSGHAKIADFRALIDEIARLSKGTDANRADKIKALSTIAEVVGLHPDVVHLPAERVIKAESLGALKQVAESIAQSAPHQHPELDMARNVLRNGDGYEFKAGQALAEALADKAAVERAIRDGKLPPGDWLFVPASKASTADDLKIDGMLVDLKTGKCIFIDFAQHEPNFRANPYRTLDGKLSETRTDGSIKRPWAITLDTTQIGWGADGNGNGAINKPGILERLGHYMKGTQPAAGGNQPAPHVYDIADVRTAMGGRFPNFGPVQGELDAQIRNRNGEGVLTRQAELRAIEALATDTRAPFKHFGMAAQDAGTHARNANQSFNLVYDGWRAAIEAEKYGVRDSVYGADKLPDCKLTFDVEGQGRDVPAKYRGQEYISLKGDDTRTPDGRPKNVSEIRIYKNGDVVIKPHSMPTTYVELGGARDLGDRIVLELRQRGLDPADFSSRINRLRQLGANFASLKADITALDAMSAEQKKASLPKFWADHPELRLIADGTQHGQAQERAARDVRPLFEDAMDKIKADNQLNRLSTADKEELARRAVALDKAGHKGLTLPEIHLVGQLEKTGMATPQAVEAASMRKALGTLAANWTPAETKTNYEAAKQAKDADYPRRTNLADVHQIMKLRERLVVLNGAPVEPWMAEGIHMYLKPRMQTASEADLLAAGKMYDVLKKAGLRSLGWNDVAQVFERHRTLSAADITEVERLTGLRGFRPGNAADVVELAKRNASVETSYGVDRANADRIRTEVDNLLKGGTNALHAHDVAALKIVKSMAPADAVALGSIMGDMRDGKPRSFEGLHDAAVMLRETNKFVPVEIRNQFRDMLAECIRESGGDTARLREMLMNKAFHLATDGNVHEKLWIKVFETVEATKDGKDLATKLSLPEDAAKQKTALENVFDHAVERARADGRNLPFETRHGAGLGPVNLNGVNRALLDGDLIGRFADKVGEVLPDLAKPGAPERLRNMIGDFFKDEGIAERALDKDRMEVVISAEANRPRVAFKTEGNREVERRGAEFFLKGTNTPVEAGKVTAVVTVPEALVKGDGRGLSGALFKACIDAADRGVPTAGRSQSLSGTVVAALAKHASVPEATITGGPGSASGLDASALPVTPARPVECTVSDTGVKIPGVTDELSFKQLWKDRIEMLEKQLEELKKDPQRNRDAINEKQREITHEKGILTALSDSNHPNHGKAVTEVKERMKDARISEQDIERLGRDRAVGDRVRGRMVAVAILLGFIISKTAGSAQAAETRPPVPKSGGDLTPGSGGGDRPALKAAAKDDKPATKDDKPAVKDDKPVAKDRPAVKDVDDKPAAKPEAKLSELPNSDITRASLTRMLPDINRLIASENVARKAADSSSVDRPLIDLDKVRLEWEKGEFGPESRKLWREAQHFVEKQSLELMKGLDSRGLPFPPGAPIGPGMSESGSGLRESDELFRTRLRTGQIDLKFGFKNLAPGELPSAAEAQKLVNAVIWMGRGNQQMVTAFIEGQGTATQFSIDSNRDLFPPGRIEGWKKPEGASPEQLERWSSATSTWLGTANRVRFYAEAIATLNNATTTRGMDFPSLTKAIELLYGVGNDKKIFPDEALLDANFPGKVVRRDGRIVSVQLDMPSSVDRSPENLAKMAKFEAWLAKYGPKVDQVFREVMKIMSDSGRTLMWAEHGDIDTTRTISGAELIALKDKNKDAKVGDRITLANGDKDYVLKEIKNNGSWVLEARTPDGQTFNLKRYGFEVTNCDRDGTANPNGQFRRVVSYEDYHWARDYAYNNWIGVESRQRVYKRQPDDKSNIYHQDDFVPIFDNGRTRLMQVKNLNAWANAAETSKQAGNVANLVVDAGMLVTGLAEFRAAWVIAKKGGEIAMREFVKQCIKASWHTMLGATGFAKQAIVNELPYGKEIMHARHIAILADLSFQLLPEAAQSATLARIPLVNRLWGGAQEGANITELWMKGVVEAGAKANWFDRALVGTHRIYEGGQAIAWTPKIGLFPLCDYYFLAQFSDVLRTTLPGEENQHNRLVGAYVRYGREQVGRMERGDAAAQAPVEAMRRMTQSVLGDYSALITPGRGGDNAASRELSKAVNEARLLPATDAKRTALQEKLLSAYRDIKSSEAERLASARGLIELAKDAEGRVPERVTVRGQNLSIADLQKAIDRHPQTVAARTEELAKLAADAPARTAYISKLAETFRSSTSHEEKAAAAHALLRLAADSEGKLPEVAGAYQSTNGRLEVKSKDVQDFADKTGEGLLKRAQQVLFLPETDPKRQALANDAIAAFRQATNGSSDRLAAAMVLMSMRTSDNPDEKLGGAQGYKASDVWRYLQTQSVSGTPEARLAAGDFMLRTSRSATNALAGQEQILAGLETQLKTKPNDNELKERIAEAKTRIASSKQFQELTRFDYAEFGRICMDVLNDPKSSRQTRLDAMVSPNGPRLGMILQQMKYHIEPALNAEQDQGKKLQGLASIYGRDSHAMQRVFREVAANNSEDPDVRAMASRMLRAADAQRPTVNGVNITPGVEMKIGSATNSQVKITADSIVGDHARLRLGHDGRLMIRDMGSTAGTIIVRANGTEEKVGRGFTAINPGDKIIVGDKRTGHELVFSTEGLQQLALGATDARSTAGTTAGALAEANKKKLLDDLNRDTGPSPDVSHADRIEARASKLSAAEAALDLGHTALGLTEPAFRKLVATALADCINLQNPELAKRALGRLTPELIATLDVPKADALRESTLSILANGRRDTPTESLRLDLLARSTDIFANASREQRSRLANICECVLLPGAQTALSRQDSNFSYPTFGSATQELCAKAVETLAVLNPDRAAEVAKLLLLGGSDRGQNVERALPSVRLAAVKALAEVSPPDLQATALSAMRTDSDPRVLAELAKVEFGSRRPDLDPIRMEAEIRDIQARLGTRAKQGDLQAGKARFDELMAANERYPQNAFLQIRREALTGLDPNYPGNPFSATAIKARQALLWLVAEGPAQGTRGYGAKERAPDILRDVVRFGQENPDTLKRLAGEMVGGLEYAMQSNLRMGAAARGVLVDTYLGLKPGTNGIVSKEEAAVVLAGVLQNELRNNSRNPYDNFRESQANLLLQDKILTALKDLKTDKVIPMLLSLAGGERIRSFDSEGRPAAVQYGNTLREFSYARDGKLASFTETPPAKTYRREGNTNDFKATDGSIIKDAEVITRRTFSNADERDRAYRSFGRSLLTGEVGDFRYTKDGITYLVKPNGTVMTEELKSNSRKITITYPDGRSSREFNFTKSGDVTTCAVKTQPGDTTHTWTSRGNFGVWQATGGLSSSGNNRDGFIQPFNFDQAHYVYNKDNKQFFADANGGEFETGSDRRTVTLKPGSLPADAHPDAQVRREAALALCHLRESTAIPRQTAVDEIEYIRKRQETEATYLPAFGPKATTSGLADEMAKALANSSSDARAVVTTLYKGFLSKPLESNDPRLVILRAALNDGNDLVRMAAARMLMTSTAAGDKERSLFASADLSKNSGFVGLREEATKFLDEQKTANGPLVTRALAETPDRPRRPAEQAGMNFDIAVTRDVRFQRAFEQVKRTMLEGQPQYLRWTAKEWENFCKTTEGYALLSRSGFVQAGTREVATLEQNRGRLSKLFDSAATIRQEQENARESVIPKMWRAFDTLVKNAMEKKDDDPQGQAARRALVFVVASRGEGMHERFRDEAVTRAVDAINRMCKGSSPGRGDFEAPLVAILTQSDLSRSLRTKLLESLDALGGPGGKVSNETIASTATVALEREYRFMPRPGQPGYQESIDYQKKLLEVIKKYGNREIGPAMDFFKQNHSSDEIKRLAGEAKTEVETRADRGSQRLVDAMIADTAGTRRFSSMVERTDNRIPLLVTAMNNTVLPEAQRLRAATILMAPEHRGITAEQRQSAINAYADLGLKSTSETVRFDVASSLLDHTKSQYSREQREKAAAAMGALCMAGDKTTADKALAAVQKLTATESKEAVSGMLRALDALKTSGAAIDKEKIATVFDAVGKLYESSTKAAHHQAQLLQAVKLAGDMLGSDHARTKALADMFIQEADGGRLRLASATDVRIQPLVNALASTNREFALVAARVLLEGGNFVSDAQKQAATAVVLDTAANTTGNTKQAAKALLDGWDAKTNLLAMEGLVGRLQSGPNPVDSLRNQLTLMPVLFEKTKDDPKAEAAVFKAVTFAKTEAVRNELLKLIDRCGSNTFTPLSGAGDARMAVYRDAVNGDDRRLALTAALALLHKDAKDVAPALAVEARKTVYRELERMLDEARATQTRPGAQPADKAAAWARIDGVLANIGEKSDDYGRTYVLSRKLEMEGGKDNELLPLYQRLARLSRAGGSEQAARIFEQRAEAISGRIGATPDISRANEEFVTAKQTAADAIRTKDATKIADAERQLKAVADRYKTLLGENSTQRADAITELASFYSRLGKHQDAARAAKEAVRIWDQRREVASPQRTRAIGTLAVSTYGQPGGAADFADARRRLLASTNDTDGRVVTLDDGNVLKEVVDYMISRGAISNDNFADVDTMSRRALDVTRRVHGAGSQQAAAALETQAGALAAGGRPAMAIPILQQARSLYQLPGLEADFGRASGQLGDALASTGRVVEADAAYVDGIQAMTAPGVTVDRTVVEGQLDSYLQHLVRTGQTRKAQSVQMAAEHYAQTGILPPLTAFGGGGP